MVLHADKIFIFLLTKLDDADFSSVSADGLAFPSTFSSVSCFSLSFFPNVVIGNCDSSLIFTSETQKTFLKKMHVYELEY